MTKDYGHRLADYAYKLINDDFGKEFDRHLRDWKIYSNSLVVHAHSAFANFQNHLEAAKKTMEAEKQANQQLGMFVLSLLAGPAMSFISGAIQYRLGPKLFGNQASTIRTVPNPKAPPKPPPIPPAPKPLETKKPSNVQEYVRGPDGRARKAPPPPGSRKEDENARGYKHQKDVERHEAARKAHEDYNSQKTVDRQVFDPDWSKTKGKVLGDLGSTLVSEFMVNPVIKAAPPNLSVLQNAINRVPDSVDLVALDKNLNNVWEEAQSAGHQAIQFFANTFREDNTWGDRLWAKLVNGTLPGVRRGADDLDREQLGRMWIRQTVNQQRRNWASRDGWFYYGNVPAPFSPPQVVNAIETEMWALWFVQEKYDFWWGPPKGHEVANDAKMDPRTSSRSGIGLELILPRLRQLGVLEGDLQYEAVRRINADKSGLMKVEINNIYGEVDTMGELKSINSWAANRKPTLFGGKLASVRRTMGDLVVSGPH